MADSFEFRHLFLYYGMGVLAKRLWVKNGINRSW